MNRQEKEQDGVRVLKGSQNKPSCQVNRTGALRLKLLKYAKKSTPESTPMPKYNIWIYKGGDLPKIEAMKKAWYVAWSFEYGGKMIKQERLKLGGNKYKNYKDRLTFFKAIAEGLEESLRQGYDPYNQDPITKHMTSISAIEYALGIKEKHLKKPSFANFKTTVKQFSKFLIKNQYGYLSIKILPKDAIVKFLDETLEHSSKRNRNNTRDNLFSLFNILENSGYCRNLVKGIAKLKTIPQKNKTFTEDEVKLIFNYLKTNDPNLLLFIKFVSYNFLRPIEVCRLKVGDIQGNTLSVFVKQGRVKKKIIPSILLKEIKPLLDYQKEFHLFTFWGTPRIWDATEPYKRKTFSDSFLKIKNHFGFGSEYGIYSFRHSFATKIYNQLLKTKSPFEAKSFLMEITGHSSMQSLEKYLRDIDAYLPDDYSDML